MQIHAIMRAAKSVPSPPHPEIMIPLVGYEQEIQLMRELVIAVGNEEGLEIGADYTVGTMIELPRACFVANLIAKHADFFSFGTNDLTQTALGFSRDDVESAFVPTYVERKIIDRSPFETIDAPGVGWLVRLAAWVGREARPELKLGVCGEHGGDPASIDFEIEAPAQADARNARSNRPGWLRDERTRRRGADGCQRSYKPG